MPTGRHAAVPVACNTGFNLRRARSVYTYALALYCWTVLTNERSQSKHLCFGMEGHAEENPARVAVHIRTRRRAGKVPLDHGRQQRERPLPRLHAALARSFYPLLQPCRHKGGM